MLCPFAGKSMADILCVLVCAILIILIWVAIYDSNRFVVRQYRIADGRIRKKVKAVILSDLHNKRYGRENERLIEAIRGQEPDIILIAGDMVTAKKGETIEPAVCLIKKLAAEYPVYYGYGNHEHRMELYPETYGDMAERLGQALADIGIEPLVNARTFIKECGIEICGVQIGKEYYRRLRVPNMKTDYLDGLLGKAQDQFFTVLLAHNPDYFAQYAQWGADLVVSGHVHGGVARVPVWGKGVISPGLRLFPKFDGGIYRNGGSSMILSRGLGMHTIPVRLFNPGELWTVTLEPSGE